MVGLQWQLISQLVAMLSSMTLTGLHTEILLILIDKNCPGSGATFKFHLFLCMMSTRAAGIVTTRGQTNKNKNQTPWVTFTKYVFAKKVHFSKWCLCCGGFFCFFYNTSEVYKNKMVQEHLLEYDVEQNMSMQQHINKISVTVDASQ